MTGIGLLWGGRAPCRSAQTVLFTLDPVPGLPFPYCLRQLDQENDGPTAQSQILSRPSRRKNGGALSTAPEHGKSPIENLPIELLDMIFSHLDQRVQEERKDGLPPQPETTKREKYPLLFVCKRFNGVVRRQLVPYFRNAHNHELLQQFTHWLECDPSLGSQVREIEVADHGYCPGMTGVMIERAVKELLRRQASGLPKWQEICLDAGRDGFSFQYAHEIEIAALLVQTPNVESLTMHIGQRSEGLFNYSLNFTRQLGQPCSTVIDGAPHDRSFLPRLRTLVMKNLGKDVPIQKISSFPPGTVRRFEVERVALRTCTLLGEPLWQPRSNDVEVLAFKHERGGDQSMNDVINVVRACKALKSFTYEVQSPAGSSDPPEDPNRVLELLEHGLRGHRATLETLSIYISQPMQTAQVASIELFSLAPYTVLKHVNIPLSTILTHTWDMPINNDHEPSPALRNPNDLFPSCLQTLSINGIGSLDWGLALNILGSVVKAKDDGFRHFRSIQLVSNDDLPQKYHQTIRSLGEILGHMGVAMRLVVVKGTT